MYVHITAKAPGVKGCIFGDAKLGQQFPLQWFRRHKPISCTVIFASVFALVGLFVMPHLPPHPARPVTAREAEFWTSNWAGALAGAAAVALDRGRLRRSKRK
jgi:hypothetical protein